MKNIRSFYEKKNHFLVVKFSVYLNRHVSVVPQQMLWWRNKKIIIWISPLIWSYVNRNYPREQWINTHKMNVAEVA